MENPGLVIFEVMQQRHITQAEVARLTSLSQSYISQIVNGKVNAPKAVTNKIMRALNKKNTDYTSRHDRKFTAMTGGLATPAPRTVNGYNKLDYRINKYLSDIGELETRLGVALLPQEKTSGFFNTLHSSITFEECVRKYGYRYHQFNFGLKSESVIAAGVSEEIPTLFINSHGNKTNEEKIISALSLISGKEEWEVLDSLLPPDLFEDKWIQLSGMAFFEKVNALKLYFKVSFTDVINKIYKMNFTGAPRSTLLNQYLCNVKNAGRFQIIKDKIKYEGKEPFSIPSSFLTSSYLEHLVFNSLKDDLISISKAADYLGITAFEVLVSEKNIL